MSSKTDAFLKLGLFFFIALLSFSIGTFVGKKFSDNQHQLAALEPQKNSHGDTGHGESHADRGVASTSPSEHRSGAMTDEEIAKLAEEFVADDTVPATTTASHDAHGAPAADAHGKPAPDAHGKGDAHGAVKAEPATDAHGGGHAETAAPSHASEAAKNVAQGKAPTAPEVSAPAKKVTKEERLPSSLPKDVAQYAVGKFTVQVAAYPQEAEAQKMASDLKTKGYSAFYIPANVKGTTYYRVSVGQFATQKEATTYRAEFLAKSKMGSAIVQKISE